MWVTSSTALWVASHGSDHWRKPFHAGWFSFFSLPPLTVLSGLCLFSHSIPSPTLFYFLSNTFSEGLLFFSPMGPFLVSWPLSIFASNTFKSLKLGYVLAYTVFVFLSLVHLAYYVLQFRPSFCKFCEPFLWKNKITLYICIMFSVSIALLIGI